MKQKVTDTLKRGLKSRVVWLIAVEIIIVLILFVMGFRITYNSQLQNSWDAISACASWAGAIATTVAVLVAVRIPKIIAQRQDKIALFEKRFAFYAVLSDCIDFSLIIKNIQTNRELQMFFVATFGKTQMEDDWSEREIDRETVRLQRQVTTTLQQGVFLFDFETEIIIKKLVAYLISLLYIKETHENFWIFYSDFMDTVRKIEENLLPEVKKSLKL